jgi:thiamine biosynthesis protein ThiS
LKDKKLNELSLNNKNMNQSNKILNINGSNYVFDSTLTILELMDYLGFNNNVIVIDYNGLILEKDLWKGTYLKHKDALEILSIAGGG